MTPQVERLIEAFCSAIVPPPDITISQWADKHRHLSPEASARRGQWRTLEYQREPMDCLSPSHPCEQVVLKWASQIGKTEIGLNFIGYVIAVDPGPMLAIEPNVESVKALSKDRVATMVRDTPDLHGKVKDVRSRDSDNTILHKSFLGGHITFVGANSPSGLAMRPMRYLYADETDRYPVSAGTEGDPVLLAIRRTGTYRLNRKILLSSSPTITGKSRIDKAYQLSDQRSFHVPCPFCGHEQKLIFEQLKWPKGKPEEAQYECANGSCQQLIPDYKKAWMVENGRWIAANPSSVIPGFHLNQLYSVLHDWSDIASEWLGACKNPETRRVFDNTVLAETWEEQHAVKIDEYALWKRCEAYDAEVPTGVGVLTAGVDVQADRIEIEVVGWGRDEESWSIAYHVLPGNPGRPEVWQDLDRILTGEFTNAAGVKLGIKAACVDSGSQTAAVYKFTRERYNRGVFAIKGIAGAGHTIWPRRPGKARDRSPLFIIGVDSIKEAVYNKLKFTEPGPSYCHFPEGRALEYFTQLTSEKKYTKYQRGFSKSVWGKEPGARNEALDNRGYALAALHALYSMKMRLSAMVESVERRSAEAVEMQRIAPPVASAPVVAQPQQQQPASSDGRYVALSPWMNR
jgi:phage terminase large subunit GpA-like protein